VDLRALAHPDARVVGPETLEALRRAPREAAVVRPYGSVSLYHPGPGRRRVLDLDPDGHVTLAIRRAPGGALVEAWARQVDGDWLGILPGGAAHPVWGPSDRLVRSPSPGGPAAPVTLFGAVAWDAIAAIPPLAEPARLPPGAGTTVLNVLAALAADQAVAALRYRGPYATEQLFWALVECFRYDERAPDPLPAFLSEAEAAFAAAESREAPLDWAPAPHERRFGSPGLYVQLRDGVEKVVWEGRAYYRPDWQGLVRREHRVVRPAAAGSVAGLQVLGRLVEPHLVLDARGHVLDACAPPAAEPGPGTDLSPLWREALGALLPLEATPLLAPAIAAVWPGIAVTWTPVARDLVAARGAAIRLSPVLAGCYRAERAARPPDGRRALARDLVREVLGLVGPAVRAAAAAWLEAQPAARQAALLEAGARDPAEAAARAAPALARLLDALAAGEALPW
jgi:hypothetical protein